MKLSAIILFVALGLACGAGPAESQRRAAENPSGPVPLPARRPVLVELYTSEG